jgi:hypothetical protein
MKVSLDSKEETTYRSTKEKKSREKNKRVMTPEKCGESKQ